MPRREVARFEFGSVDEDQAGGNLAGYQRSERWTHNEARPQEGTGLVQSAKSAGAIYEDLGVEVAGIEPAPERRDGFVRRCDLR